MILAGDTSRLSYEELTTLKVLKETSGNAISVSDFLASVDVSTLLEDGESFDDVLLEDPDATFYAINHQGKPYYGFQSCGVDRLFSTNGTMPLLDLGLDSTLNEQCRFSQLAWVLAPCGSLLAEGPMRKEFEVFRTESLARYDGLNGSTRLQLLHQGKPVCGMHIRDMTVQALYTDFNYQGQGFASRLFDFAYRLCPELQHNDDLTDDGKAFVAKYEAKRQQAQASGEALTHAYVTELNDLYSSGRCMFLAVALKRLFNYEMQAAIQRDEQGEYIAHAWVKMPNGNLLDIGGQYPEAMNPYSDTVFGRRVNNLTEAHLKTYLPTTDGYEKEVIEAMKVVRDFLLPTHQFSDKYQQQQPEAEPIP